MALNMKGRTGKQLHERKYLVKVGRQNSSWNEQRSYFTPDLRLSVQVFCRLRETLEGSCGLWHASTCPSTPCWLVDTPQAGSQHSHHLSAYESLGQAVVPCDILVPSGSHPLVAPRLHTSATLSHLHDLEPSSHSSQKCPSALYQATQAFHQPDGDGNTGMWWE